MIKEVEAKAMERMLLSEDKLQERRGPEVQIQVLMNLFEDLDVEFQRGDQAVKRLSQSVLR